MRPSPGGWRVKIAPCPHHGRASILAPQEEHVGEDETLEGFYEETNDRRTGNGVHGESTPVTNYKYVRTCLKNISSLYSPPSSSKTPLAEIYSV
ncbi:hypothetical protein TcasGA2_TC034579 [Tribolium castaneum]|uniref:Uncharacterized protein n=1 Tax=Tribolium castaneum TaxID=7070 RepID=A0A139WLT1_TRICA|nr:hypothetical protein TcasGA2_TC034579 [Tribolium castaneum]